VVEERVHGLRTAKIEYRANDEDQARVAGKAGQQLYLNFATGEGEIKLIIFLIESR